MIRVGGKVTQERIPKFVQVYSRPFSHAARSLRAQKWARGKERRVHNLRGAIMKKVCMDDLSAPANFHTLQLSCMEVLGVIEEIIAL